MWYGVYGSENFVLTRFHDTNKITLYQGILRINLHRITIDNSVSRTIKRNGGCCLRCYVIILSGYRNLSFKGILSLSFAIT